MSGSSTASWPRSGRSTPAPEDEVVDCTGCLLVPGGIDTHTHLDLEAGPILTADDFATGSRAALAGGTTTVLDFATQFHGESLQRGLERWHEKADGRAVCDYGFHLAMTEWRPEFAEQLAALAESGVTSFKMYMAYRHSMMVDDDEIYAALTASAAAGATIGFHCENGRVIDALVHEQLAQGHTGSYWHQVTRPPELEAEAVERLTTIAALRDAPTTSCTSARSSPSRCSGGCALAGAGWSPRPARSTSSSTTRHTAPPMPTPRASSRRARPS